VAQSPGSSIVLAPGVVAPSTTVLARHTSTTCKSLAPNVGAPKFLGLQGVKSGWQMACSLRCSGVRNCKVCYYWADPLTQHPAALQLLQPVQLAARQGFALPGVSVEDLAARRCTSRNAPLVRSLRSSRGRPG
jgi:hypothetical protein